MPDVQSFIPHPSLSAWRAPAGLWFASLAAAALLVGGCASRPTPRQALQASSPLTRAEGVVRLAENGDPNAVASLVEMLEDPDRGVRMFAIVALRRLCGEDFGYRYYQTAPEREAAVEAWREALREGRVQVQKSQSGAKYDVHPSAQAVSESAANVDAAPAEEGGA